MSLEFHHALPTLCDISLSLNERALWSLCVVRDKVKSVSESRNALHFTELVGPVGSAHGRASLIPDHI